MEERYYSIIHPIEYIFTEDGKEQIHIKNGCIYIYKTFSDEEYYIKIKRTCIRYKPREFFFILGYLRKIYYCIYYYFQEKKTH